MVNVVESKLRPGSRAPANRPNTRFLPWFITVKSFVAIPCTPRVLSCGAIPNSTVVAGRAAPLTLTMTSPDMNARFVTFSPARSQVMFALGPGWTIRLVNERRAGQINNAVCVDVCRGNTTYQIFKPLSTMVVEIPRLAPAGTMTE